MHEGHGHLKASSDILNYVWTRPQRSISYLNLINNKPNPNDGSILYGYTFFKYIKNDERLYR